MKRLMPVAVITLSLLSSLCVPATAFARPAAPPAQQTPQPGYTFAAIYLGGQHACALTTQGGVLCWGSNQYGQLGTGTTVPYSSQPVKVRGLDKGVKAVAMKERLTCALTEQGGVLCWGRNEFGQLGDGTKEDRSAPVPVRGLNKGVKAIAVGGAHTCALTEPGGVLCWGSNWDGQLGDGTKERRSAPVRVRGLDKGVKAIAAGDSHTCALTEQGGVLCWGGNEYGQLGDGTKEHRSAPVPVRGLDKGVKAIAAGGYYTCALTEPGGVLCWGSNRVGQLGDGTKEHRSAPVPVRGLDKGVKAIATGGAHTCALTEPGGVLCWGSNWSGQLGDGTKERRSVPVRVRGLDKGVKAIAAGGAHTCALTEQGGVLCWGRNERGQLGDGTKEDRSAPVPVRGLDNGVKAIAVVGSRTCALTEQGGVLCWGDNWAGQLGDGTKEHRSAPVPVRGLDKGVKAIAVGSSYTCALTEQSGVLCWGNNWYGQLGDGTTENRSAPVPVRGLDKGVKAIALSDTIADSHACALTEQGSVLCWGSNAYGQLGDGSTQDAYEPIKVKDLTADVSAIVVAESYNCALTAQGTAYCWGLNDHGQLGAGSIGSRLAAVDARGLDKGVKAIATGGAHTCALTEPGGVLCWGGNWDGELGDGTKEDRSAPVRVRGLDKGVKAIASGGSHTCALTETVGVLCWGGNRDGQLGDETKEGRSAPVPVRGLDKGVKAIAAGDSHTCALTGPGGVSCVGTHWQTVQERFLYALPKVLMRAVGSSKFKAIASGGDHTCALTEQSSVVCAGDNFYGQLGDGTFTPRTNSAKVTAYTRPVAAIAGGEHHTCVLTTEGGVLCWGRNQYGQLGNGEFGISPTPVAVVN